MYAALTPAYNDVMIFGKDSNAERDVYTQFLEEASAILGISDLNDAAGKFCSSAVAWNDFAEALLPDEVPLLKETRQLMLEKHHLFLEQGNQSLSKVHAINGRLTEIKSVLSNDFPMSDAEGADLRTDLRDRVLKIGDIEQDAISELARILD